MLILYVMIVGTAQKSESLSVRHVERWCLVSDVPQYFYAFYPSLFSISAAKCGSFQQTWAVLHPCADSARRELLRGLQLAVEVCYHGDVSPGFVLPWPLWAHTQVPFPVETFDCRFFKCFHV